MKPNHITYHTEDNRLQAVQDYNIGAYYGYDSQGERGLKLTGPSIQINQNGYIYHVSALKEQTLYASPLITINDKGYTKHYFEEGKRICSKIGSGELRDINDLVGHMEMNYEEQLNTQYEGIKDGSMSCFGGGWFDLENNNLYKSIIQPYENPINPDEPSFYYHSDHLGSASFLTDRDGKETQQLVYLPFGEDWVDMKYNTQQYDTPYKFNGKEKDEETGYNNYGARYYTSDHSIWLSVDPLSDKYPHLTSYNYCANNPVMLIDPDGREIGDPPSSHTPLIAILLENFGYSNKIKQAGYLMSNPSNAMRIKNNLNVVATNFQINIGNAIGRKENVEGGPQNAIRHTLWNALMSRDLGNEQATRAANSHETGWSLSSSERSFSYDASKGSLKKALIKADNVVDLLNNEIGRRIGLENPNADNKTLASKVMEEYYTNGLYTTTTNKSKVEVVKTRITKAQYNAAMKEIARKGNNGLNE